MSKKISFAFRVQVAGGPAVGGTGAFEVEAIDELQVLLPATDPDTTVTAQVQPGDGAQMIVITSTIYEDISYTVDGGDSHELDGPHVLLGEGAVSLLGDTQNTFAFTNAGSADATVNILVGRNATS